MPEGVPEGAAANLGGANLRGIGWMLLSGLLFVAVTGFVRHLGTDMSPMQAAFIRYAFGLVLMTPLLLRLGGRGRRRTASRRLGLHALRGLIHGIGVMLWFYAMARIPIAEVTARGALARCWSPSAAP